MYRFINLKWPIIFLKVNPPDKEICAISLPDIRFSAIVNGNKKYCCKMFSIGILFKFKKNKIDINVKTHPPIKNLNISNCLNKKT